MALKRSSVRFRLAPPNFLHQLELDCLSDRQRWSKRARENCRFGIGLLAIKLALEIGSSIRIHVTASSRAIIAAANQWR